MLKIIRNARKGNTRMERGQVLVLVGLAAIGIIAIIGLVMDVGMMFVGNARLRRATDAAALAAALQYREGVQTVELTRAATEFLQLNGVILDGEHPVTVDTCSNVPSLCLDAQGVNVPRKLVRVRVSATIKLAFLPVIGIDSVPISAEATSETASLDLVLVIDTSESMTFDAPLPTDPDHPELSPLRDPTVCNDDTKASAYTDITDSMPGECHPFEEVKKAAVQFVDRLYYPYDRVAVVTFDKTATNVLQFDQNCDTTLYPSGCTINEIKATIESAIRDLKVFEGEDVCDTGQPCRPYCTLDNIVKGYCDSNHVANFLQPDDANAVYKGVFDCGDGWYFDPVNPLDPSHCTTTDIGDGLLQAGDEFYTNPRPGALGVVILLTDGSANAGPFDSATGEPLTCPSSTWNPQNTPLCRDASSETRHCGPLETARCIVEGGVSDPSNYDADDYARDMADFVGIDQDVLIFSIGLGKQVGLPVSDPAGEKLLQYAAERVGNGLYFYAPQSDQLADIFKKIGDNIATRLAR